MVAGDDDVIDHCLVLHRFEQGACRMHWKSNGMSFESLVPNRLTPRYREWYELVCSERSEQCIEGGDRKVK